MRLTRFSAVCFTPIFILLVLCAGLSAQAITNQRLRQLENMMRQITNTMIQKTNNLEMLNRAQAAKLTTLAEETTRQLSAISEANAELRQRNAELQTMLGTFERFFGSLLVESPDSFNPTRNAIERMDTLNAFLGNREAMLAGLRPDPPTVPKNATVNQEELGRVLTELSDVSSQLNQKVSKLERRVDNGVIAAAGDRSLTGGTDDILTIDQIHDRVRHLEAQLDAITAIQLEKDSADRLAGSNDIISDRDRDILEGSLYGDRSLTSARKSVFSVGRTRSMFGQSLAQKIEFNYIYANKGNHWNSSDNAFVVGITGYYYLHFSLRSYDSRYIGVLLMKNDEHITAMYTEPSDRNVMESQAVILPLRVGDRIWLRLGPSTLYGLHSDSYKYCTFSGFLVYKGI